MSSTVPVNGASIHSYANTSSAIDVPNLIEVQLASFDWLKGEGFKELLEEISPIEDFTGNRFELRFLDHQFKKPKSSDTECRKREITYSAPLYVTTQLLVKETGGEIKEQTLFFGDVPIMTPKGTFIINGAERVVVSQLVRSPGIYFTKEVDATTGRGLGSAKLIPYRGAWLELETSSKDVLSIKVDRKRKAPVITFLRALGYTTDEEIMALFKDVDKDPDHQYIASTIERNPLDVERYDNYKKDELRTIWNEVKPDVPFNQNEAKVLAAARIELYTRLRPGEPPSLQNAGIILDSLFFKPRRYDLGRVGRHQLNRRLGTKISPQTGVLTKKDIESIVRKLIEVNNDEYMSDDIDHLGNRRVRSVGELIQNQLRVGFLRMDRVIKERMTIIEAEQATPAAMVNIRPVVATIREFFGGSQLSQFMDQTNPLAELTHKRRLSALGPGGLSRERAGFEVRDVHSSHYGRICPIETPEGPNIGLLGSMATYAKINEFGFIETPYKKVLSKLHNTSQGLKGRTLSQDIVANKKTIASAGQVVDDNLFDTIRQLPKKYISVKTFVSTNPKDIVYLSADQEEKCTIAQAKAELDDLGQIISKNLEVRQGPSITTASPESVDYMDVSPMQIVSVSTSLIPFLEHDDANRALMGSNMQRQAVPLLNPEAPIVSTGMEKRVALDSGQVILAEVDGTVTASTGYEITIADNKGKQHVYPLTKFLRSNQSTSINQRPIVDIGDHVEKGQAICDSSSTDHGELALGQNVIVAFMIWEGYNFEDAMILSEQLVKDDKYTSIHLEKYECEARDTKLGPEEITRDITNLGEDRLSELDEDGIIRIGAEVGPGDILVGKITPKGETELTAEEKLLRAIFGEKARDVKDTSLRVPPSERGKIIDVKVLTRENKDELLPGVNKLVRVWIAQTRKVSVGDKLAGRHGNKGVVSRIMPVEDMPYLEDGTPVQMILNPIGVPSRMNLGQVLETHLGWVGKQLGFRAITPVFDGAQDSAIEDGLGRIWFIHESGAVDPKDLNNEIIDWDKLSAWLKERGYDKETLFDDKIIGKARTACMAIWLNEKANVNTKDMPYDEMLDLAVALNRDKNMAPPILGKMKLYDGRTGESFAHPVTVGSVYVMKLIHLVEDKIHARSTGPYSLITQQPLGGKALFGGQRFGEMEVWALEAYSAAYNLQEMLTVKSDDVIGRQKSYEALVKGEDVVQSGIPESFQVLVKELQSLSLSIDLLNSNEERVNVLADGQDTMPDPYEIARATSAMESDSADIENVDKEVEPDSADIENTNETDDDD